MSAALIALGSYVVGGVPVAYLTGRLLRGIDIRRHGSRNVGASNVWQSVSRAAVVPVGLAEIVQGLAGPGLAKKAGHSRTVQVLAGLAALTAHNWSPFLRFTGGRGIAHSIGFMLAVSRPALGAFIGLSLIGVVRRQIPQFVGLGIVVAPLAALMKRQPPEIIAGMAGMAALVVAKRLVTNDPAISAGANRCRVLFNRLVYDRDSAERETWVRQAPG